VHCRHIHQPTCVFTSQEITNVQHPPLFLFTTHSLHTCSQHTAYISVHSTQPTYLFTTHSLHICSQHTAYIPVHSTQPTYLFTTHSLHICSQCTAYISVHNTHPTYLNSTGAYRTGHKSRLGESPNSITTTQTNKPLPLSSPIVKRITK